VFIKKRLLQSDKPIKMPEQTKADKCIKCGSQLNGRFCSDCGHNQKPERINGRYILTEIGKVLNFDKGILYTIKELMLRPGLNVQKFLLEDRYRLVKPIYFLLITSLVYTIAQQTLHFEDEYVSQLNVEKNSTTIIFEWIQQNYGYSNILMSIFIVLWLQLFFRKHDFNFFEILILLCFVMGMGMLIYTAFGVVESLTSFKVLNLGGLLGIVYASWAIGSFFGKGKFKNYLKGFAGYFLGMITFFLGALALGTVLDLLKM
jgi:hypothetical protein